MRPARLAAVVGVAALALSGCASTTTDGSSAANRQRSSAPTAATTPPTTVPAPIADLMEKASMGEQARRLFLDADPKIESKAELQRSCRNTSSVHTLGCFLATRRCELGASPSTCSIEARIHLLRIERADLKDLMYVSAAHEMLHAAYEALAPPERAQLNAHLQSALPGLDQCRLSANLAAYSGLVGDERLSELHSILGTEFPSLPPALQAHYSRYLVNRQSLVQAHDRTLGGREQEICGLRASLDQLEARITGLRGQLRRLRSSGNVRAYNTQVASFNADVSTYNRLVATHNTKVGEYNDLLTSLGNSADALQQRGAAPPAPR